MCPQSNITVVRTRQQLNLFINSWITANSTVPPNFATILNSSSVALRSTLFEWWFHTPCDKNAPFYSCYTFVGPFYTATIIGILQWIWNKTASELPISLEAYLITIQCLVKRSMGAGSLPTSSSCTLRHYRCYLGHLNEVSYEVC